MVFSKRVATICSSSILPSMYASSWTFTGPTNNHSVTDATGLGLYNTGLQAPGFTFSYVYFAAGTYTYVDLGTTSVSGEVDVPITLGPTTGTSATVFAVRWKGPR